MLRVKKSEHEVKDKETNTTQKKFRGCVDCNIYPSQDCGECGVWASNNELSRAELGRQLKIDAIDDLVECLMANEVVDKSVVRRTAEQFKAKLKAKKTK